MAGFCRALSLRRSPAPIEESHWCSGDVSSPRISEEESWRGGHAHRLSIYRPLTQESSAVESFGFFLD
jgi:hypothetical protein